jgi:hypothetical protein
MSDAHDYGNKLYWGPLLWKCLHMLAEVSDRRDMALLWTPLMRHTAAVLPCDACRTHLGAYLRTHNFVKFGTRSLPTGAQVRDAARTALFRLHNAVNARLEKPEFATNDILPTYVGARTRDELLFEIQNMYDTLKTAWTPFVHGRISGAAFSAWRTQMHLMITLATCGSQ